jgi:hypothetical protein
MLSNTFKIEVGDFVKYSVRGVEQPPTEVITSHKHYLYVIDPSSLTGRGLTPIGREYITSSLNYELMVHREKRIKK